MRAAPESDEKDAPARPRAEFAAERALYRRHTIPELIDLLESEDLRTRFLAEMSLRDATDT
jgi:hypothetical protein